MSVRSTIIFEALVLQQPQELGIANEWTKCWLGDAKFCVSTWGMKRVIADELSFSTLFFGWSHDRDNKGAPFIVARP